MLEVCQRRGNDGRFVPVLSGAEKQRTCDCDAVKRQPGKRSASGPCLASGTVFQTLIRFECADTIPANIHAQLLKFRRTWLSHHGAKRRRG